MYGAVANSRPENSPVSAGTSSPRPFRSAFAAPLAVSWAAGASATAAARRPVAATNPAAMTMAHSEGNRSAVAEVPSTAATTCMSR